MYRKNGFTLLEIVFIIIIVGIISIAIAFKPDKDAMLKIGAKQLITYIRYTQHLALVDDKFSRTDSNWFKKRWTIIFNKDNYTNKQWAYTIFSDFARSSSGNPDISETAKNPLDSTKLLSGGFSGIRGLDARDKAKFVGTYDMNLGIKYGVTDLFFSKSCSYRRSKRISFDHVGRPLIGKLSSYKKPYMPNRILQERCIITLSNGDSNISIAIEPETGYVNFYDTDKKEYY